MDFTDGWSITTTLDLADASRQGQDWKESVPLMGSWTGSFSGQCVMGNTEQKAIYDNLVTSSPGTKLTDCVFDLEDTGDYLSGDLYINSVTIDARIGDIVKFTTNFTGNGQLSLTVA